MGESMKNMPVYLIELEQSFYNDMPGFVQSVIKQVDKERRDIMINQAEELLRTRQYSGATTDYLDGIRETIELLKS
jgi:hypothetical protein